MPLIRVGLPIISNLSEGLAGVAGAILAVFVGWVIIQALVSAMPGFRVIGTLLLIVIVVAGITAIARNLG